jgi:hypothetical protein
MLRERERERENVFNVNNPSGLDCIACVVGGLNTRMERWWDVTERRGEERRGEERRGDSTDTVRVHVDSHHTARHDTTR